jgi:hypothetical protein
MPTDEKFGLHTRVSDILYPFTDLREIEPAVLKNAANRGTVVHTFIDSMLADTGLIGIDAAIKKYAPEMEHYSMEKAKVMRAIESFSHWYPGKKFIEKPARFFCDEHLITGECDGVYEASDGLVLVDYKTPASESKSWLLQGSAYSYMARQAGYDIKRIEFVKLSKSGAEPRVFTYVEDFPLFLAHLRVYNYQYRGKNEPDENPLDFL